MQQEIRRSLLCLTLLVITIPALSAGLPAGTSIQLLANAGFSDPTGVYNAPQATQTLIVSQLASVAVEAGQAPQSTTPGMSYYIPIRITNTGNGADTVRLSVSSSAGWSTSLIRDDNSDGVKQVGEVTVVTSTGLLAADASYRCFASIAVPSGATTGSSLTITASSTFSATSTTSVAVSIPAPASHTVSFSQSPTVNPTTVDSAGTTQCSAAASDQSGHALVYTWSDGGAGGTFSPSVNAQNPSYKAPVSVSANNTAVTLTCKAACAQDIQINKSATVALTVRTVVAPKITGIIPADGETAVSSDTSIAVIFDQAMYQQATQSAISITPALDQPVYTWATDATRVTITHAGFTTGTKYSVTVSAAAKNTAGASLVGNYNWSFTTASIAQFEPNQIIVNAGAQFATSAIRLNDPDNPSLASFIVGIPAAVGIDTTSVSGSLACVQRGADVSAIRSTWNAQTREITISADVANPGSNVEIVKAIVLTSPTTQGTQQITIGGEAALTVSVSGQLQIPGDLNKDGQITDSDLSSFRWEWARWRKTSNRIFSLSTDGIYDLAPRSNGPWPNWVSIGDKAINIADATAFVESWVHSQNTTQTYSQYVSTQVQSKRILVTVTSAPYGMFQAIVKLPTGAKLNPTVGANGNLLYVTQQRGAGKVYFTEYDAVNRTVKITGNVYGLAPYYVALIYTS